MAAPDVPAPPARPVPAGDPELRRRLAEHLPAFGLEVRTPRLTLRFADDADALALAELGARGVHDPDARPFLVQWTSVPSPHLERNTLQFLWRCRGTLLDGSAWHLPLAAVVDGEVVGIQGVGGDAWSVTRTVTTGSWLGRAHQGRGIGREMRAAILHLAFDGFGAARALTGAFADNAASLGVTRALGYRPCGERWRDRDGEPARELRFVLDRADWEPHRRDDVEVVGAEAVAACFGDAHPPYVPGGSSET